MPEFYQRLTPKKVERDGGPDAATLVSKKGTTVYQYEPNTWGPTEVDQSVAPPGGWHTPRFSCRRCRRRGDSSASSVSPSCCNIDTRRSALYFSVPTMPMLMSSSSVRCLPCRTASSE